ncbi:MAG: glycine--tRNA ligase subunit beta [Pseudomonadota bacterium]
MKTDTLLIELGTEELPPKALNTLSQAFRSEVSKRLETLNLACAAIEPYAAPRRLALKCIDIQTQQADQSVEKRGPAVQAAFANDGSPTKAALGFARSCGVEIDELGRLKTDKGEWLAFNAEVKGENLANLLPNVVNDALKALPIPKRMRWGSGQAEFVRPVHWLVMLLGDSIVEGSVLDVQAGRSTYGHRFHAPDEIVVEHANDYPQVLEENGHVIAAFEQRKRKIEDIATSCAASNGGIAIISEALLDEVTALVEWPSPICGSFDEHFLELPPEVLIASMQDHQKYFPMESDSGDLINKFITIANIDSQDPAAIKAGNERVIRPRLSDATFFWDQDLKTDLTAKQAKLANIVFEKQLGTIAEKTERLVSITGHLSASFAADMTSAETVANLSRADLVSEMVGEFPELQGTMGGYYAAKTGENANVQAGLSEFYKPRFAGDAIPTSKIAQCVAVADRLDTLVGIFAIGSAPTGEKDPYALRRAALGTLRILIEGEIPLDLSDALNYSATLVSKKLDKTVDHQPVLNFIFERLRNYYLDKGYSHHTLDAVLALSPTTPFDVHQRLLAVVEFSKLDAASNLAAGNKRISNLLRKAESETLPELDPNILAEPSEKALMAALTDVEKQAQDLFQQGKYTAHLSELAALNQPINQFFDDVMVMAEDENLRRQRLALLAKIRQQFSQVADISLLSE